MIQTELYCPKCSGMDIERGCLTPPVVQRVSMDDYPPDNTLLCKSLVYRIKTYRLTCRGCGYSVRYSE